MAGVWVTNERIHTGNLGLNHIPRITSKALPYNPIPSSLLEIIMNTALHSVRLQAKIHIATSSIIDVVLYNKTQINMQT